MDSDSIPVKSQIPRTKSQVKEENPNEQTRPSLRRFEYSLFGIYLGFGDWDLEFPARSAVSLDPRLRTGDLSRPNMTKLTRVILFLILALALAPSLQAANSYAAIAYSPSSGQWGYGNGYPSQAAAIARARAECGRSDARTFWCKNSWIALAISDSSAGGFGWAYAPTAAAARSKALALCRSRNPDARVVVCVSAYR